MMENKGSPPMSVLPDYGAGHGQPRPEPRQISALTL